MTVKATKHFKDQRGAALVVGLIFLLLLSVIGVASMQSTGLQERMAGSFSDQNQALQAAELALRHVEDRLAAAARRAGGSDLMGIDSGNLPTPADPNDPSICPTQLRCSGFTEDDRACINALPWQNAPVSGATGITSQFAVIENTDCLGVGGGGWAEHEGDPEDFGASSSVGGGGSCTLIVARGQGPSGTSEAVLQAVHCKPFLRSIEL